MNNQSVRRNRRLSQMSVYSAAMAGYITISSSEPKPSRNTTHCQVQYLSLPVSK